MNSKIIKILLILFGAFLFYLATGNGDLFLFGIIWYIYFELRVMSVKN